MFVSKILRRAVGSPIQAQRFDKIVCLGKNYLDHAKELGDAVPELPVIFNKPPSCAVFATQNGETIHSPLVTGRGQVHYECEILLKLDAAGKISAVSLGLDLTLRDVQKVLKEHGHPWEIGKSFPGAAVVGPWVAIEMFPAFLEEEFTLAIDGQVKQRGFGKDMRMGPSDAIKYIEGFFPVCEGDVIFTGTPAGVGPVNPGQKATIRWGRHLSYDVIFDPLPASG